MQPQPTVSDQYPNYAWRETHPGKWEREADEVEIAYASLIKLFAGSGRMFFAITGHLSLTLTPPDHRHSSSDYAAQVDTALRIAWARLRHQMPTIASRVDYSPTDHKWKKTYHTIPDATSRDDWLDKTFKLISNGQTGTEFANSDPPAPSIATLFVVVSPTPFSGSLEIKRDLILRSPHDIIDGIGTLQLFNQFLHHFSTVLSGDSGLPLLNGEETTRLSPPYRVAANVPPHPNPQQLQKLLALKTATENIAKIQTIGIPHNTQGPLLPGKHQRTSVTLSPSRTTNLLSALKSSKTTPTYAFHAAIAISEEYPLLLRPSCVPPYNSQDHAAAVYHSVSGQKLTVAMPSVPPTDARKEFQKIMAQRKEYYLAVHDDPDHFALAPYIWAASTATLPPLSHEDSVNLPVPPPRPDPSVSISSMGVVDTIIPGELLGGRIKTENPWVTGEEVGTGLGLFLGSFKGRLTLSAAYNDAWHSKEEVESFLERVERLVFQGVTVGGLKGY
ncbi:hypothetical protein QBC35DRAFT_546612 [Podospora australis]|uniref:Uncharacterized protein n=1 Tax=Podospora australis TaxID=1536484 RepID=A0AAN6WLQ5_9PEZI|nr:hypothetical protein QBC35DRAFT_546612 [Podospora australis]